MVRSPWVDELKTVGIDVDGVIRNFHRQLLLVARITNPKLKVTENFSDYWLKDAIDLSREELRQICHFSHPSQVFVDAPSYEDNVLFLIELMTRVPDYEFVAITASGGYDNEHLTYKWLGKHELNFRRVIFTNGDRKAKENIDILVDDSVANYKAWCTERGTKKGFLLMDRPWNRDCDADRIKNLGDLLKGEYVLPGNSLDAHKLQRSYDDVFKK